MGSTLARLGLPGHQTKVCLSDPLANAFQNGCNKSIAEDTFRVDCGFQKILTRPEPGIRICIACCQKVRHRARLGFTEPVHSRLCALTQGSDQHLPVGLGQQAGLPQNFRQIIFYAIQVGNWHLQHLGHASSGCQRRLMDSSLIPAHPSTCAVLVNADQDAQTILCQAQAFACLAHARTKHGFLRRRGNFYKVHSSTFVGLRYYVSTNNVDMHADRWTRRRIESLFGSLRMPAFRPCRFRFGECAETQITHQGGFMKKVFRSVIV